MQQHQILVLVVEGVEEEEEVEQDQVHQEQVQEQEKQFVSL